MASCLGIYVQNNIIKYAKVTKDHGTKKIDAFGIKFFEDDLYTALKQVIEETYSFNIPISVNLDGESYNYFNMFALLSKKDLQKAIKTEFESFCNERGYNPNVFEKRYAITPNVSDKQKLDVIYVTDNKIELNKINQLFSEFKLKTITPISMAISTLRTFEERQNSLIVNIEENTIITTIIDQQIYRVQKLQDGMLEILEKINLKENSYSKSYEVCKNTTIYTSEGNELQGYEDNHLEDIMPTLYSIVGQVKKLLNEQPAKIEKVYITGTAALINNIDLYFQEYLEDVKCEILRPDFITSTRDITIKDYIEVNSAVALSLMGLEEGIQGMNFKTQGIEGKISKWSKKDAGNKQNQKGIAFDLGQKLSKTEKMLLRSAYGLFLVFVVYSVLSSWLGNQLTSKKDEADGRIEQIKAQIKLAEADDSKIKLKTSEYSTLTKNLQEINNKASARLKSRNAIPNLLNQIMYVIPESVQITSIQNTSDTHIEIYAQSDKYEQLGYLKAKIKSDNILNNVISTAGKKENEVVTVKIEGELP